jgi:uncharacterized protein (DUF58 family)
MSRAIVLSTLIVGFVFAALLGVNGLLLAISVPLLLALGVGVFYAVDEIALEATRILSTERLIEGSTLSVKVTITNNGGRLAEVQIRDQLSPRLIVTDGATSLITTLAPKETVTLQYEISGPRGSYSFPSLQIAVCDPLGLFWKRRELLVAGTTKSLIVPSVEPIGGVVIRPNTTRSFAGYIPARLAGSGVDFFGVREYRAGDPQRHLNWHASARHPDTLYTNEFEQERVADVGLILDARQRAITRANDTKLLEYEISAANAFAESFLADGNRVSLLVYGNFLNWTLPGYGKIQRQRITQNLSSVTIGTSQVFSKLDYLPTRLFPAKSQLVVFSTLLADDVKSLRRMRARGYAVLVVSPDPVAYEQAALPPSDALRLAARLARIERELLFRELRQSGIQVLNWDVRISLKELVKVKLNRPMPHGGMR